MSGLTACAEKNIVHHNVKPDTIFKGFDGNWKIAGFGPAQQGSEYAPPEVTLNETSLGVAADVYSAGIVFFELFSGHVPTKQEGRPLELAADAFDMLKRALPHTAVATELVALCKQMLNANPDAVSRRVTPVPKLSA